MSILQILYVSFLFLFLAVSIYEANKLVIISNKLKNEVRQKDIELLGTLYNIKNLINYSETHNIELVRDYVNLKIGELIEGGVEIEYSAISTNN